MMASHAWTRHALRNSSLVLLGLAIVLPGCGNSTRQTTVTAEDNPQAGKRRADMRDYMEKEGKKQETGR